jgi:hypothetical protein
MRTAHRGPRNRKGGPTSLSARERSIRGEALNGKQIGFYLGILALMLALAGCGLAKKEKQTADSIDKDSLAWPRVSAPLPC